MAIWFLCTLLFTIFSGLYYAYDPQRLSPAEDKASQVAGLFDACRKGAAIQATQDLNFGLVITDVPCDATGLPAAATVQGLNVPGVRIMATLASVVDPATTGRMLVTYISPIPPNATVMNSIPQRVAKKQILETFRTESNTGNVEASTASPAYHVVQNGTAEHSRVPLGIPLDSVASVEIVQ